MSNLPRWDQGVTLEGPNWSVNIYLGVVILLLGVLNALGWGIYGVVELIDKVI